MQNNGHILQKMQENVHVLCKMQKSQHFIAFHIKCTKIADSNSNLAFSLEILIKQSDKLANGIEKSQLINVHERM